MNDFSSAFFPLTGGLFHYPARRRGLSLFFGLPFGIFDRLYQRNATHPRLGYHEDAFPLKRKAQAIAAPRAFPEDLHSRAGLRTPVADLLFDRPL